MNDRPGSLEPDRTRLTDRFHFTSQLVHVFCNTRTSWNKPKRKMQATRSFALLSIIVAGCASKPARPGTAAPEPVSAERPAPAGEAPIRVTFDTGLMRYQAESRTAMFAASDTTVPLDSIVVTAQLSLSARNAPMGIALSATVERLSVTTGLGAAKSSQTLAGEFKLAWSTVADSVFLEAQPARTGCDQLQETARDLLVSIFPPLPEFLSRDQSWRATSNSKSCRAGLILDVSSRSQLQVSLSAPPINRRQVTVRSAAILSIAGSGMQGASAVTVRGSGTLGTIFQLDLTDGVLRSAQTQGTIQIEFDLGYRTDRLVQSTRRLITRVQ